MPAPLLVAATLTPLGDDGSRLDLDAIGPMMTFLESHGVDGAFACGTTGEGVLLSLSERREAATAFRAAVHDIWDIGQSFDIIDDRRASEKANDRGKRRLGDDRVR